MLPEDSEGVKAIELDHASTLEMICDWVGAGRAQGTPDTLAWYEANKDKLQLHPVTRALVESTLGL